MTALGLAAGGASKTIQQGLDRDETRKARIARATQAQNAINAEFKLYSQKREDEINDNLQDLIGSYRAMELSNPQIAGLIQGGDKTLEEVRKYYDSLPDSVKTAVYAVIHGFWQVLSGEQSEDALRPRSLGSSCEKSDTEDIKKVVTDDGDVEQEVQPKMMQFKCNYRNLDEAKSKIDILKKTLEYH